LGIGSCLRQFGPDLPQFTRIQPITPTVGTFINFNLPFGAEEMTLQLHFRAARAIAFPQRINFHIHIAPNVQQRLSGGLVFLINALQLESVEPNPATAAVANVNDKATDLHFGKLIEASRTSHKEYTHTAMPGQTFQG
jgi:hypothetical protein